MISDWFYNNFIDVFNYIEHFVEVQYNAAESALRVLNPVSTDTLFMSLKLFGLALIMLNFRSFCLLTYRVLHFIVYFFVNCFPVGTFLAGMCLLFGFLSYCKFLYLCYTNVFSVKVPIIADLGYFDNSHYTLHLAVGTLLLYGGNWLWHKADEINSDDQRFALFGHYFSFSLMTLSECFGGVACVFEMVFVHSGIRAAILEFSWGQCFKYLLNPALCPTFVVKVQLDGSLVFVEFNDFVNQRNTMTRSQTFIEMVEHDTKYRRKYWDPLKYLFMNKHGIRAELNFAGNKMFDINRQMSHALHTCSLVNPVFKLISYEGSTRPGNQISALFSVVATFEQFGIRGLKCTFIPQWAGWPDRMVFDQFALKHGDLLLIYAAEDKGVSFWSKPYNWFADSGFSNAAYKVRSPYLKHHFTWDVHFHLEHFSGNVGDLLNWYVNEQVLTYECAPVDLNQTLANRLNQLSIHKFAANFYDVRYTPHMVRNAVLHQSPSNTALEHLIAASSADQSFTPASVMEFHNLVTQRLREVPTSSHELCQTHGSPKMQFNKNAGLIRSSIDQPFSSSSNIILPRSGGVLRNGGLTNLFTPRYGHSFGAHNQIGGCTEIGNLKSVSTHLAGHPWPPRLSLGVGSNVVKPYTTSVMELISHSIRIRK